MECAEHKNSLCRVCLKCDPTIWQCGASIIDKLEDVYVYEKVNTICDVDIKPQDGLPDRICVECLQELHNAVRFKQKCETSNKVLLSAVNIKTDSEVKAETIQDVKLEDDHYTEHEFLDEYEFEPEHEEVHSPPPDDIEHEHGSRQEGEESIQSNAERISRVVDLKLNQKHYPDHHDRETSTTDKACIQSNTERPSRAINLKLECHDCGGLFRTKCKLKVHWKREHLRQYLTCDKCKRVFNSFITLNNHKNQESLNCNTTYKIFNIEGTGRYRKYYCKQCDYTTTRNVLAFKHTVKHTGVKRFTCDLCDKSFTQRSGLHYHRECFHKIYKKEAKCIICSKFIQGLRNISIHMRRHKNAKNTATCEICHKTFKKYYLKIHMERHLSKKGHVCEVCLKEFPTRGNLRNHIKRMHERNADLMCPKCGYKHHDSRVIDFHISKHTGDNLPCLVCGRFFKNDELLASHMNRHNYKNYKCSECDKVYFGKKFLIRHLKDVHNIG